VSLKPLAIVVARKIAEELGCFAGEAGEISPMSGF
jgi:hypothetical protein